MDIVEVPGRLYRFEDFLGWWLEQLRSLPASKMTVDLGKLDPSLVYPCNAVVRATGHNVGGYQVEGVPSDDHRSHIVLTETIFVDTEVDPFKRRSYFEKYCDLLSSVARQHPVKSLIHYHITHCSIDKTEQVVGLAVLINRLNQESAFSHLLLNLYSHPTGGYTIPANPSKAQAMLPNKTQEKLAISNFRQAVSSLDIAAGVDRLIIRGAIDDDDLWTPWAMSEILTQVCRYWSEPGSTLRVLALARQFVYYPQDGGRIDMVDMQAVLNGSKVYISDSWERIRNVSVWTLTEVYAENRLGYYQGKDVTVRITHDSRAVLIYVRGFSNFSGRDKESLYLGAPSTLRNVGPSKSSMEAAVALDSSFVAPPGSKFVIDPPVWKVYFSNVNSDGYKFGSNTEDFIRKWGMEVPGRSIVVSARYEDSRFVRSYADVREVLLPPGNLTRPVAFILRDSDGAVKARSWVEVPSF